LCVIGAIIVARFLVWEVGRALYKRLLRPAASLKRFGQNGGNGAWAVVTGASDGIGKAYALTLAKRGFNILLISRTQSKLDEVATEIKAKHKVKTEVHVADFAAADGSFFDGIKRVIDTKCQPVGILVNNVGISYPFPGNFLDVSKELCDTILNVNIRSVNEMSRMVLPKMVEKKAGAIINVSSISGAVPAPMLAVYSGSKAYVNFFSQCLATEYARSGIAVQSITPSLVVSNMSKIRRASLVQGVTTPEVIVNGSLNDLGYEIHWSPFWVHALQEWAMTRVLPLSYTLNNIILKMHISIRKRALAKLEADKKKTK